MEGDYPLIAIAAPSAIVREIGSALGEDVEVMGLTTWEQAVSRLKEVKPSLIIVCYVFDEMRPFRLINYVRHDLRWPKVPVILVRALPVPLGETEEAQIRESYRKLGVVEFFNLFDFGERAGRGEALERLRHSTVTHLRRPQGKRGGRSSQNGAPAD
jgi:hypothetical protein